MNHRKSGQPFAPPSKFSYLVRATRTAHVPHGDHGLRAPNGCVEHTRLVAWFPTSQGSPGPRPACPAGERVPKLIRRNTQPPLAGGPSGRQPGGGKRRVATVLVLAGERLHLPDKPAGVVSTLRCPGRCATHPLGALSHHDAGRDGSPIARGGMLHLCKSPSMDVIILGCREAGEDSSR